jgi:PII-like signaling protein
VKEDLLELMLQEVQAQRVRVKEDLPVVVKVIEHQEQIDHLEKEEREEREEDLQEVIDQEEEREFLKEDLELEEAKR